MDLDKELRLDFSSILKQEETLWAMKSRIDWLTEEDNKTKFFHTSTLVRRKTNRIYGLKDNLGNWLYGNECISHVINLFQNLYASELESCSLVPLDCPDNIRKMDSFCHENLLLVPDYGGN